MVYELIRGTSALSRHSFGVTADGENTKATKHTKITKNSKWVWLGRLVIFVGFVASPSGRQERSSPAVRRARSLIARQIRSGVNGRSRRRTPAA